MTDDNDSMGQPTVRGPSSHPSFRSVGARVDSKNDAGSGPRVFSRPAVDLLDDPFLVRLPRTEFEGADRPCVGGLPLLAKLGQGGMGAVYLGYKALLEHEIAVKILPMEFAAVDPSSIDRFIREARLAARIESPHLVRVTDVGEESGVFYLIMEFVRGKPASAWSRTDGGSKLDEIQALDIVIAATRGLAAAHRVGVIHRDVKPDNILVPIDDDKVPHFRSSKLADLGLARPSQSSQHSLTGASWSMGTPGYMAPEQALNAKEAGAAADIFSMGATLYSLLAGEAPFRSEVPTATVIQTIQEPHKPLRSVRPDISEQLSELVDRCLAKSPGQRPAEASALLAELIAVASSLGAKNSESPTLRGSSPPGRALSTGTMTMKQAPSSSPKSVRPELVSARLRAHELDSKKSSKAPLIAGAAAVALVFGLVGFLWRGRPEKEPAVIDAKRTVVTIATGAEKLAWMQKAAEAFAGTPACEGIEIEVKGVAADDFVTDFTTGRNRPAAWSPASPLFWRHLEKAWYAANGRPLSATPTTIALSPMVIAMYESRYEALTKKHGKLNFQAIYDVAKSGGLWKDIAGRDDWGRFTFAISDPSRHSSGLAGLVLIAADLAKERRELSLADVTSTDFEEKGGLIVSKFKRPVASEYTMRDMVLKGPGQFDAVYTYENVVIDYLPDADGRWEPLKVIYPEVNLWNDHPFYVFDSPVVSEKESKVAKAFLAFLLSEPMQKELVMDGFRPGNPRVPIRFPDSPFQKYEERGVKIEIPIVLDEPKPEVIEALLSRAREWTTK